MPQRVRATAVPIARGGSIRPEFRRGKPLPCAQRGLGGVLPPLRTSPPSRIKLLLEKAYKNLRSDPGKTMGSDSRQRAERGSGEGAGGGLERPRRAAPVDFEAAVHACDRTLALSRATAPSEPRKILTDLSTVRPRRGHTAITARQEHVPVRAAALSAAASDAKFKTLSLLSRISRRTSRSPTVVHRIELSTFPHDERIRQWIFLL